MSNKMAPDVAADIASSESLSFAGLVCIQDQHPPNQLTKSLPLPLPIPAAKMQNNEPEFEFGRSKSSSKLGNLINDFSTDKSFSDSQVLPQVKVHANQSQVSNRVDLEAMLSPIQSHRRSDVNQSKFRNSNKKQIMEVKYKTNEKCPSRQSFSQRFFQSFATPCRDCRVVRPAPSMKEPALQ
ncbi:Hypothetical predicted protein [Olea europaea subsp. europaea]|uniref:Uncharacterized protein n=1 Tax=Olea europaea subsp. europaea TaxID=158383 RepID=A0A8S0PPX5_OLEEU|nr:Hypothetical predicted protein [Olea europaea subsp. europaea]